MFRSCGALSGRRNLASKDTVIRWSAHAEPETARTSSGASDTPESDFGECSGIVRPQWNS